MSKPFTKQSSKFTLNRSALIAHHMWAKVAIGSGVIAIMTDALGYVDHDRNGQTVILASELHQRLTVFCPNVGRINDGQQTSRQTFAGQVMKHVERIARCLLIVFIVGDPASERIR
jgi:hypothetical protein